MTGKFDCFSSAPFLYIFEEELGGSPGQECRWSKRSVTGRKPAKKSVPTCSLGKLDLKLVWYVALVKTVNLVNL